MEKLILSSQASPVSPTLLPENSAVLPTDAISVSRSPKLSTKSGRASSSSRTCRNLKPCKMDAPSGVSSLPFVTPDTRLVIESSTPEISSHNAANGCSFADIAEPPAAHLLKYSLSLRAANGVLTRAARHRYRLPPVLLEGLLCCIRRGSAQ